MFGGGYVEKGKWGDMSSQDRMWANSLSPFSLSTRDKLEMPQLGVLVAVEGEKYMKPTLSEQLYGEAVSYRGLWSQTAAL